MLRNFFFFCTFIPASIAFSSLAVLAALFDRSGNASTRIGHVWARICLALSGIRLEADLTALPKGQNVIFMPNHTSYLDILVLYTLLKDYRIGFVAKEVLFTIPIFGKAMRSAGHIPIDRGNSRRAMKSIDYAVEKAHEGVSIVIFPEGTRNVGFEKELGPFQIGGMIMALKCGIPVAPLVIDGTGDIMPKGRSTLAPGRRVVRIKALPLIEPGRYTLKQREQFKEDLRQHMNATYMEMRQCPVTTNS
ncbi:MAG: lysophospholipid acyltransferase family protein [Desulfovibrionaceae bacterium]